MPTLLHLFCILTFWISSNVLAWAIPAERPRLPEPLGYVSDHAQTLDADWKVRIRSVCQDLERKTGVEMVVVTVPTIKPFASAQLYAEALYQQWKIGSASEEHGALILLAVAEHQAAITVGKRMVPIFTPEVVAKVGSEYMDPALRMGHFGEGLYRTVVGLAANAQNVRVGPPPRSHMKGLGFLISLLTVVAAVLVLWWISRPDLRHPYGKIRRGEYWGSGQGGFSGNFGGLGGTMGGDGLGQPDGENSSTEPRHAGGVVANFSSQSAETSNVAPSCTRTNQPTLAVTSSRLSGRRTAGLQQGLCGGTPAASAGSYRSSQTTLPAHRAPTIRRVEGHSS